MRFLWKTLEHFLADDCLQLAAALAYYAVLSLAPFLVLTVAFASLFVAPEDIQGEVARVAQAILGPQGAEQLQALMGQGQIAGGTVVARAMSAGVLVFAAMGMMLQLQSSLNRIWEVDVPYSTWRSFFFKRALSLVMIVAVALVLVVSLLATTISRALANRFADQLEGFPVQSLIGEVVTLLTATLLFAAVYKVLPDVRITWGHVWFGAIVTALLFMGGNLVIGWYLGSQQLGTTYGAASSFVLLLLWTYYSALTFFFGAELTRTRSRTPGEEIEPLEGAVRASHNRPEEAKK